MKQNIYDNDNFFNSYLGMRKDKKGTSANDLIEIPTIRSMLPNFKNKKVLELGCGSGENSLYFINNGALGYLGTDISSNMINFAKEKYHDVKIKFEVMAMEDLSKLTGKYDVVVSSLAIHYVENFNKLCHDVYNILNDKGYFIFSQEHPIGTGVILNKECNLKDTIKIGDKDYFLVSDYNNNGKRVVNWYDQSVVKYHRNFSYIINTILKNNFSIIEFREPLPTKEILEIKPKYKNQFDKPYFLFIKLQK